MSEIDALKQQRLDKLQKIKALGINPYPSSFKKTAAIETVRKQHESLAKDVMSEDDVNIAGRIIAWRDMGKAGFLHLWDWTGKMQVYVKKDQVGEQQFKLYSLLDRGDFLGVTGKVFYTRTGELTVIAKEITLLSKSLRALPAVKEKEDESGETVKYDEVSDIEFRYRQRYVDLNVNEKTRDTVLLRSKVINTMRTYLTDLDFIEVETPVMQSRTGGATAKPFKTFHNALSMDLFLRIAPELFLKRLVVGGLEKVFEIGRNFRNEGISTRHNPEFTMMELYLGYASYHDTMQITEHMIKACAEKVLNGKKEFSYQGMALNFESPWKREKLEDLFKKHAGIDFSLVHDRDAIAKKADELGVHYEKNSTTHKIYDHIFEEKIQPLLINPTIVYDFPKAWSPLAKEKADEPEIVERFEIFMAQQEIGNAYSELNNPIEQELRMKQQAEAKAAGDEEASDIDEDYVRALEYGLMPCSGLGIGVDRLVMILADVPSVRDVILFPHLKPETK